MGTDEKISAALGFFDGVHMAHIAVLNQAAKACPKSIAVIINRPGGKHLITPNLKYKEIKSCGISEIVEFEFEEVRYLSCNEFVKNILKDRLHITTAVCGYNFHFGHSGIGDSSTLSLIGINEGIDTVITPPVIFDSTFVSSTRIRNLLADGHLEIANTLLTRSFGYDFPVINGQQLAGKNGFPTINQQFPTDYFIPKFGVYASETIVSDKKYRSITNVGVRPTFGESSPLSETHIFDFTDDLYGQGIHVSLEKFIRPERHFSGIEELKVQVLEDINNVKSHKLP